MFKPARLLAVLGLALLAGYATAQEKKSVFSQASEDAPLVHVLSGFSFPARIASFERGRLTVFNKTGDDVSVGYHEDAAMIVVTLYVYSTHGRTLAQEFASCQNEISKAHPGAQFISSGSVAVTPKQINALSATYTFNEEFADKMLKFHSELLVAQSGNWFVEYRISYPAADQTLASIEIKELLQTFAWP